jgi:Domain of unknown function (DUF4928)
MIEASRHLEALCKRHPKFLGKGGLCVALVVTRAAKKMGLPLEHESLRTAQGGQVIGLGKAAVQRILEDHGISKVLAEEGGRTSRGSLGLMKAYVDVLNDLRKRKVLDLAEVERWWIAQVRRHFTSQGPKFYFDPGKSLQANIENLLLQAEEAQSGAGGANYVGAMLQHLVGAKLDIVLGQGKVKHRGASVADKPTEQKGDFQVAGVAIHVTTHPTEALARKCAENIQAGLRPVIVTIREGVKGAAYLLQNEGLEDRVDVLDAAQFLTANVYERSLFQAAACKLTWAKLIHRYNEIVGECETDPALQVNLGKTPAKSSDDEG